MYAVERVLLLLKNLNFTLVRSANTPKFVDKYLVFGIVKNVTTNSLVVYGNHSLEHPTRITELFEEVWKVQLQLI